MRLAKQKHDIAMRKKRLEEHRRQRVAAAKSDQAEFMDNRSLFHSSELDLLKDR